MDGTKGDKVVREVAFNGVSEVILVKKQDDGSVCYQDFLQSGM